VWPSEDKKQNLGYEMDGFGGQIRASENLIKIPGYFYYSDRAMSLQGEANWLVEALRKMAVKRDFDLTLLLY